jgi:hypothetical protein
MESVDPKVYEALRDALLQHAAEGPAQYQVQNATFIGRQSGRLTSKDALVADNDEPGGLRLTMRSGHEYNLNLECPVSREEVEESLRQTTGEEAIINAETTPPEAAEMLRKAIARCPACGQLAPQSLD